MWYARSWSGITARIGWISQSVRGTSAVAVDGEYRFTITGVPAGRYRLFAGSDLDNDGFICDGGEACGAYRTLDSPEVLSVNRSMSNLDFVSGFRTQIFSGAAADEPHAIQIPPGSDADPLPAGGTR
jgi:hypothetical protein